MNLFYIRSFTENFYQNEQLFFLHFGQFLLFLFLTSSFFATIFYSISALRNKNLEKEAKFFFYIQSFSIISVFALIIYMFFSHRFEYHYIWRHSSLSLPWYYILSAFWEGQEGSFILWALWHCILGFYFLRDTKHASFIVLATLSFVNFWIGTMISGWEIFGEVMGSNPFILLREEIQAPIMQQADYLSKIKDGNGLNLLLQNYWMVIHPPVLFLGFASMTIPFGYTLYAILTKDFDTFKKQVYPWAIFAAASLGTGIIMGGMWAYEALSFGGFWAWDPVENASFVPWIIMIGFLHSVKIYQATQRNLPWALLLGILGFGLTLYSTFLTRSGILGDSSVHSFTDNGLKMHLLMFMGCLILPPLFYLAFLWSGLPKVKQDEKVSSREFWMLIGILIMILSAIQLTYATSIPVWNLLFGLEIAPPIQVNQYYNSIQIWIAIFLIPLMSIVYDLKFIQTPWEKIKKKLLISLGFGVLGWVLVCSFGVLPWWQMLKISSFSIYLISSQSFLFAVSIFSIVYLTILVVDFAQQKNYKAVAGRLAHMGFILVILGALLSQFNKKALSNNIQGVNFGKEFDDEELSSNTLILQGEKTQMKDFLVNYSNRIDSSEVSYFDLSFYETQKPQDSFNMRVELKYIQEGTEKRLNAEPSIRSFWHKDIFVHVTSVPPAAANREKITKVKKALKDTMYTLESMMIFDDVSDLNDQNKSISFTAALKYVGPKGVETLKLPYSIKSDGSIHNPEAMTPDSSLKIKINKIYPEEQLFEFEIEQIKESKDWIILKVLEFPMIRLLWFGCVLMCLATFMSFYFNLKKLQSNANP
ncbi:MAG: cytochrome c biogenesis protein CcsA [Chitinophagales bacterium]|jgi:cytochrome c-type biogenesis protein CcmF|nr:cytochrome c biogenesis protein CcsA [Chitinophagales bacterium]